MKTLLPKTESSASQDHDDLIAVRDGEAENIRTLRLSRTIGKMRDGEIAIPGVVKTLEKSLTREKSARKALEEAEKDRAAALSLQLDWENLVKEYERLNDSVNFAMEQVGILRQNTNEFEQMLFEQIGNRFGMKRGPAEIAVELANGRAALPLMETARDRRVADLKAHAERMRQFAKKHGLPSEIMEELA